MKKTDVWKIKLRSHKAFTLKYAIRINFLKSNGELNYPDRLLYFLHRYNAKIEKVINANDLRAYYSLIDHRAYDVEQSSPKNLDKYVIEKTNWTKLFEASEILEKLYVAIKETTVKFGCFPNHKNQILKEIEIVKDLIKSTEEKDTLFNMCLIAAPDKYYIR